LIYCTAAANQILPNIGDYFITLIVWCHAKFWIDLKLCTLRPFNLMYWLITKVRMCPCVICGFFWCMGAVLAGCCSRCHQWLILMTVKLKPTCAAWKSSTSNNEAQQFLWKMCVVSE